VVMNQGRIEQTGTPDEVFHQPANAFVMDFLGNVNLFHGRVEAGKAVFGSLVIETPAGMRIEGENARLLVRPHDLEILPDGQDRPGLHARVARIQSAGPMVKVELLADNNQALFVEMAHDRFREAPRVVGDRVIVTPRQSRLFVEDYSI
jgi:sulfate/thiosulfate transport system ATP-binding protein